MISSAETWFVKLKNELKALKASFKYAFSSVLMPDNVPSTSWSGTINFSSGTSEALARFRVRFTRNDGRNQPPFVDFAQTVTFNPSYPQYSEIYQRVRMTGDDINYVDNQLFRGYVADVGTDYVDYYIDITTMTSGTYIGLSSVDVAINVEAISMVPGTINITRLI